MADKNNNDQAREVEEEVPEEELIFLEETITDEIEKETFSTSPVIQDVLNFDLTGASEEEKLENYCQLRYLLGKATELLNEKTCLCTNLEKQIKTFEIQICSLKSLVSITKDILSFRNMEIEHLYDDIRNMEVKIDSEKEKRRLMLTNMNDAVKVMSKLKEEYEIQMDLFTHLQDEYTKNIECLQAENRRLLSEIDGKPLPVHLSSDNIGEGDTPLFKESTKNHEE